MSPIEKELCIPEEKDVRDSIETDDCCWIWLIIMRAFEEVRQHTKRDIGDKVNSGEDMKFLEQQIPISLCQFNQRTLPDSKYLKEFLRFGTSKIHSVSAFLGGLAA